MVLRTVWKKKRKYRVSCGYLRHTCIIPRSELNLVINFCYLSTEYVRILYANQSCMHPSTCQRGANQESDSIAKYICTTHYSLRTPYVLGTSTFGTSIIQTPSGAPRYIRDNKPRGGGCLKLSPVVLTSMKQRRSECLPAFQLSVC